MAKLPFEIDTADMKELEKDLKFYAAKVYPLISRDTINNAAFKAQQRGRAIVSRRMVNRNKFTIRSIQVDKARGMNVKKQEAAVGSTMDYMLDQEFGITKSKTGSKGVAIPTSVASGEGQGVKPRRKVVRRPNRRSSIKLLNTRIRAKSRKQAIVATIQATARKGGSKRFAYLPFKRHPGIYWITGGKKKARIRQVYDFSKKSVTISPTPWLRPASRRGQKSIPAFFRKSTKFHLYRAGLFR